MVVSRKGFTLIELLIVIAILGIIVVLILPRFADVREDSNTNVCIANLRGLASAMATYEAKENTSVEWGSYSVSDLVDWEYIAAEPYCPYESESKTPYTLVESDGTEPDLATCPQSGTYTDHVWP